MVTFVRWTLVSPFGLWEVKLKQQTGNYSKLERGTDTTGRWLYNQSTVQLTVQDFKHLKNQEKPMDGGEGHKLSKKKCTCRS